LIALFVPRQLKGVLSAQGVGRKSKAQVLVDLERHVAALDGLLSAGDWLVGPSLTLADISVYAELACIDGTPEGTARIDAAPRVRAWLARVDGATRA
jgi:glutathione S-transferase